MQHSKRYDLIPSLNMISIINIQHTWCHRSHSWFCQDCKWYEFTSFFLQKGRDFHLLWIYNHWSFHQKLDGVMIITILIIADHSTLIIQREAWWLWKIGNWQFGIGNGIGRETIGWYFCSRSQFGRLHHPCTDVLFCFASFGE